MFLCTDKYRVYFEKETPGYLIEYLEKQVKVKELAIICDSNTHTHCWPVIAPFLSAHETELFVFPAGEENKNMATAMAILEQLLDKKIKRKDLIINLGGGVVTDLGGFCASIFKRGIPFIHIPTSLLGMVDASVGGKTGVDFKGQKNMLGTFTDPLAVFIWPEFLKTLPEEHLRSGKAEAFKHGLIDNPGLWNSMCNTETLSYERLIFKSLEIKKKVVDRDPKDSGERKKLNYGHTIAHALEAYYLAQNLPPLYHGDAVAAGMVIEGYLSWKYGRLPKEDFDQLRSHLINCFPKIEIPQTAIPALMDWMENDKKNDVPGISFVLLDSIGEASVNQRMNEEWVKESLEYYMALN
jgi:3-dehydroquinate synthase